jgi:hypothetical protein
MANRLGKVLVGTEAERPTSSSEMVGILYVATDTDTLYRNSGSAWVAVGGSGGSPAAFSGARVYRGADQTITNAGAQAISFDTEHFDVDGYWVVGSPTRLTVPADGYYYIGGQILWDSNTTAVRATYIMVDGTTYIASVSQAAASVANMQQNVSAIYHLTANQYVELMVNQTSTGDRVAEGATDFPHRGSQFWIARLGI